MKIHNKYIKAIESLYRDPRLRVRIKEDYSERMNQRSGIRQRCPLSPYLFIITMTVLFRGASDGLDARKGKVNGLDFVIFYMLMILQLSPTTTQAKSKPIDVIGILHRMSDTSIWKFTGTCGSSLPH